METRILEITIQYTKHLNKVNLITKTEAYAVVSLSGYNNWNQKTKTPKDHDGDANPNWNFLMKFTVDEAALHHNLLTLDFRIVCERVLGDKDIGEVHVSFKELFDSTANGGAGGKHFVSYQFRRPSGKPKVQLTFSHQFGKKIAVACSSPPYTAVVLSAPPIGNYAVPVVAYPAGHFPPPAVYPPCGGAPAAGGYPPQSPYGYGYPAPSHSGYGYPPPVVQPAPNKKSKWGVGLGAGLLGGAIGGLFDWGWIW